MKTQETQNSHADLLNKRQVSAFQVPSFKTYYNSNEDRIPLDRSRMCRFRILEKGVGQGLGHCHCLSFSAGFGQMDILMVCGKYRLGCSVQACLWTQKGCLWLTLDFVKWLFCIFLPLRLCGFQWAVSLCGLLWILFSLSHGGQNVTQTSCEHICTV